MQNGTKKLCNTDDSQEMSMMVVQWQKFNNKDSHEFELPHPSLLGISTKFT